MACNLLALALLGLTGSQMAPQSEWQTATGAKVNPFAARSKPSVLIFQMTDCPISNLYAPEIGRIIADYSAKGVSFFRVYVDQDLSAKSALTHGKEYGLQSPIILDPRMALAKRVGATVSPEAVVLDPKGKVVYRGRIDDRVVDYGKVRDQARRQDLRIALNQTLAGEPVTQPKTTPIGCIFRKPN